MLSTVLISILILCNIIQTVVIYKFRVKYVGIPVEKNPNVETEPKKSWFPTQLFEPKPKGRVIRKDDDPTWNAPKKEKAFFAEE